jgi:hypothetical protein
MFALLSEKQTLVPHLLTLKRGSGTKHQPDKQEDGKATIENPVFKVRCGTIHRIGSWLCDEWPVIVPGVREGAELYLVAYCETSNFSLTPSQDMQRQRSERDQTGFEMSFNALQPYI